MKSISTVTELKEAIRLQEIEQAEKVVILKDQFSFVVENLNPLNLARNFVRDIASPRHVMNDIIDNAITALAGYFSKIIIAGKSPNSFQKLSGSILQLGVIKLVSQYKEQIRSFANVVIQSLFSNPNNTMEDVS